jgi:hypothetical protein
MVTPHWLTAVLGIPHPRHTKMLRNTSFLFFEKKPGIMTNRKLGLNRVEIFLAERNYILCKDKKIIVLLNISKLDANIIPVNGI